MNNKNIENELARILQTPQFSQSKRLTDFLRYIVTAHLEGKFELMNETVIAQDVFGKTADFDPTSDAIVRVTASRLRMALKRYYAEDGAENALHISIPVGTYAPKFSARPETRVELPKLPEPLKPALPDRFSPPEHKKTKPLLLAGLSLIALTLAVTAGLKLGGAASTTEEAVISIADVENYPAIAILPFKNMTQDARFDGLEKGFQRQIARDMIFFRVVKIKQVNETLQTLITGRPTPFDYAVTGKIMSLDPEIDVLINLIDLKTGQEISQKQIKRNAQGENYFEIMSEISAMVTNDFASHQGVIVKRKMADIENRVSDNSLILGDLNAFECYALFEQYFEEKTPETFEGSWACLERELAQNPDDATLLSSWAVLYGEVAFLNANPSLKSVHPALQNINKDVSQNSNLTRETAERAVTLEPTNDFSLLILAQIQLSAGEIEDAKVTIQQALEINPTDPRLMSVYSTIQSLLGNLDISDQMAMEALARTPQPEDYQYKPLLNNAIIRKDAANLRTYLNRFKEIHEPTSYFTLMYETGLSILENDIDSIDGYKVRIEKVDSFFDGDVLRGLRQDLAPDDTLKTFEDLFTSVDISVRRETRIEDGN